MTFDQLKDICDTYGFNVRVSQQQEKPTHVFIKTKKTQPIPLRGDFIYVYSLKEMYSETVDGLEFKLINQIMKEAE